VLSAGRLAAVVSHWLRYERIALAWWPVERIVADGADHVRWLAPLSLAGTARPALYAHPPAAVTHRVDLRRGDRCVADCALLPDAWNRNLGGVEFSITFRDAEGRPLQTAQRRVDPGSRPADRRWRRLSAQLSAADAASEVTFETRVPDWYAGENAWAAWGGPAVERRRSWPTMRRLARVLFAEVRTDGPRPALRRKVRAVHSDDWMPEYDSWARLRAISADAPRMARHVDSLSHRPLISILTPVYNTRADWLRACARSVQAQIYPAWEWCICDDASTAPETRGVLAELTDARIRLVRLERNAGIAGASQAALAAASGEFIALLDHDDELTPDALYHVAARLEQAPLTDVLYSDEDKLDEASRLSDPFFKPDWSPEHLLCNMYTCHLTVARKALVGEAGGFRAGTDGAQDHDLMLRLMERTDRITHVPRVLYHWRQTPGSTALAPGEKPWADDRGRQAVEGHLRRTGRGCEAVSAGAPGFYRPRFDISGEPLVRVVVVGPDVDERHRGADAVGGVAAPYRIEVACAAPEPASVNAAVRSPGADHVVILHAGLRALEPDWLTALLEYSQQETIGAVGGKVLYADGCIRHVGLVIGVGGGVARALHRHLEQQGYFGSAIGVRNCSAVSGECLMTRRDLFEALGGFDVELPWCVADVDYCLKARRSGRRVAFTPHAALQFRSEAIPDPLPDAGALAALRERWGPVLASDPYYNPNLDRAAAQFQLRRA
jgi:GT2 family glycosyltransferase